MHLYCAPTLLEDRGRITEHGTEMFSVHNETSPSNAAVLVLSAASSTLVMQRQKKLCRGFVDMSVAQRSSVDRPRNSATGVRRSELYSGVCPKRDL